MSGSIYFALPLMLLLAVLQTAVFPHFPIFNLVPLWPLLFALAWALIHRIEDGLVWAFIGGLLLDLFSMSLIGINAAAMVIAIAVALPLRQALPNSRYLIMLVLTAVSTLVYILVYGMLLRIWGQLFSFNFLLALLPLVLLHAILGAPIYWVMWQIYAVFRPQARRLAE